MYVSLSRKHSKTKSPDNFYSPNNTDNKKHCLEYRPVARRVPPSAIAWPYRWLFALTECGEQRSPAARLCARARARGTHTRTAHTGARRCTGAFRNRSLLYSIYAKAFVLWPALPSGHAPGEEFRGGGRIVNCYEVDFGPEIPKYLFEIGLLVNDLSHSFGKICFMLFCLSFERAGFLNALQRSRLTTL